MLNEFPILIPDPIDGGKRMVMLITSFDEPTQEHRIECYRKLTAAEEQALIDDWAGYCASRNAWLAWARVSLLPTFCPEGCGKAYKAACVTAPMLKELLEYQV